MTSEARAPLGATAEVVGGGSVLIVGVGGRLAVVCAAAAMDAGQRHKFVAQARDAVARMRAIGPRVVVIPGTLDRNERRALVAAAEEVSAEIVELAAVVVPSEVAHAVAKAVAVAATRAADALPPTRRVP